MVICEALKVANMSKSAKGDSKKSRHELRRQLEYKMRWKGGIYGDEVNPRNTSRECVLAVVKISDK